MKLNSRAIAMVVAFTALSLVLSRAVSGLAVPVPYFPVFAYEFWEVPIVAVFFLFGPKHAIAVTLLSGFALVIIFANAIYLGGIVACFSMLLGPYLATKFASSRAAQGKALVGEKSGGCLHSVGGFVSGSEHGSF